LTARVRERILRSAVREVAEKGYEETSVADLLERAELSASAFEQEFSGKEECVLAAYDWVVDEAVGGFAEAYEAGALVAWPEGIRRGLESLLDAIARHPAAARMAAVEVPAVGPLAHERYRAAIERFLPFLRDGREHSERGDELPGQAELMALGAAEAVLFDEIVGGRADRLPALLPAILFTVLVPYLGPKDAAAEMHAPGAATG
jgi:AcrR family transcriptional regulator